MVTRKSFTPATHPVTGKSKLIFVGSETKKPTKKAKAENPNKQPMFILTFDCVGFIKGTSKQINILTELNKDESFDEGSRVDRALIAMGYDAEAEEAEEEYTNLAEDDEEAEETEADETDYGDEDLLQAEPEAEADNSLDSFLEECKGKVFWAKVYKNDNGYWEIDLSSLSSKNTK